MKVFSEETVKAYVVRAMRLADLSRTQINQVMEELQRMLDAAEAADAIELIKPPAE